MLFLGAGWPHGFVIKKKNPRKSLKLPVTIQKIPALHTHVFQIILHLDPEQ